MNERTEELIIAYLHRGSTPEQESELFEECRSNPEVSELLRQHLVMSLKLRQLRDKTEVPFETRNDLLRRINELSSAAEMKESRLCVAGRKRFFVSPFGWTHVFATAAATAAIAFVFFFALKTPDGKPSPATVVYQTIRDTMTRTETQMVYKVRYIQAKSSVAENITDQKPNPPNLTGERIPQQEEIEITEVIPTQLHVDQNNETIAEPRTSPTLAIVNHIPNAQQGYLEYYKAMVSSLEQVSITATDRIRN